MQASTIVGYTTTSPNANGFKALGLNFVGVSTKATKLGDLTVSNYQLELTDEDTDYEFWEFTGMLKANKLDDQGKPAIDPVTKQYCVYSWVDYKEYEEGELVDSFTGWVDPMGTHANDTALELGDGLWVYSDADTYKIGCAGQVYDQTVPIILTENGFKMCANPVPADIPMGTIIVSNYQLELTDEDTDYEFWEFTGMVKANKLDDQGKPAIDPVTKQYCVYSWTDYKEYEEQELVDSYTGWVNPMGAHANEVDLELGNALWTYSDSSDYQLTFPTALGE